MAHPPLGARVVLRFHRPAGSVPSLSDVIGTLESVAPEVRVRAADGEVTVVGPAAVVVLKAIPPRPVRTAAIRHLEHAAAFADPATKREWVAGWVARASTDPLASSAVPLADPSMPEGDYFHSLLDEPTLRALSAWYAARGLPLQLRLPDRLVRPPASWLGFGERVVLSIELAGLADLAEQAGNVRAAEVKNGDRVLLSRASNDAVWANLVLGDESPEWPSRIESLLAEAGRRGAAHAYLEIPASAASEGAGLGAAARALGFTDHHRVRHVRLELDQATTSEL